MTTNLNNLPLDIVKIIIDYVDTAPKLSIVEDEYKNWYIHITICNRVVNRIRFVATSITDDLKRTTARFVITVSKNLTNNLETSLMYLRNLSLKPTHKDKVVFEIGYPEKFTVKWTQTETNMMIRGFIVTLPGDHREDLIKLISKFFELCESKKLYHDKSLVLQYHNSNRTYFMSN
jgi:hypothetical protein